MSVRRVVLVALVGLAVAAAVAPSPVSADPAGEAYVETPANGGSDANSCAETDPCASVARGISAAGPGGTVHVGVGTFSGALVLDQSVAIDGVSPADTVLTAPRAPGTFASLIDVTSGTTELFDLTVLGGSYNGVRTAATGVVRGDHVVVAEARCALIVSGSAALTESTVRGGTGCWTEDQDGGAQIVVLGGTVALSRTRLLDSGQYQTSVRVAGGSFTADQSYFDDTITDWDYVQAKGVEVESGAARITRSTITGYFAGVYTDGGTALVTDSTFTHNGAGVYEQTGSATVVRSTFQGDVGSLQYDVEVAGSVLGDELQSNCLVRKPLVDLGHNLATDDTCGFTAPTSRQGLTDLNLDTDPSDQGGPVPTLATRWPSPAADLIPVGATYGDPATPLCPAAGATDLRGVPRPQGDGCDAGSMELRGTVTALNAPVATDWDEPVDLEAVVAVAGEGVAADEPPAGTVTFRSGADVLCTETLVADSARCTTSALGAGPHELTAHFTPAPGSTLVASGSAPKTIAVAPAPTPPVEPPVEPEPTPPATTEPTPPAGTVPSFLTKHRLRFVVGRDRSFQVRAAGEAAPLLTLVRGRLPAGLHLDLGTGGATLRGTAKRSAVGTHQITLRATNVLGADEQVLRIVVVRRRS